MAVNPLVLAFGAGLWCLRRAALPVTLGGSCGVTKRSRAQTQGVEVMMAEPPAIVDWAISEGLVAYEAALAAMEARVGGIAEGRARELVWLLEHPPIYTAGTSAKSGDLLQPDRFPVHTTGRGGQYTYHGPGQRVIYVMLDVRRWAGSESGGGDVRRFVGALEGWLIETLAAFNVTGETRPDRVGVWVRRPDVAPGREDKIAAIGIRLKRWISLHGMSLNVEPDLEHFSGIVPCGVAQHGVTSLVDLGLPVTMADADVALHASFEARFGKTQRVSAPTAAAAIDAGPSHPAT